MEPLTDRFFFFRSSTTDVRFAVFQPSRQDSTIITSNLDFTEWGDAFPNKLLGAATLDRLRHRAYQMAWEGPSYRALQQPPKQSQNDACK